MTQPSGFAIRPAARLHVCLSGACHSRKRVPCRSGGIAVLMSLAHLSMWSLIACSPEGAPVSVSVASVCWVEHWVPDAWSGCQMFREPMHLERVLVVLGP